MALRKKVRVLEVELLQANLAGLAGGFGFGARGAQEMGGAMGGGSASATAYRDALEETAELRRWVLRCWPRSVAFLRREVFGMFKDECPPPPSNVLCFAWLGLALRCLPPSLAAGSFPSLHPCCCCCCCLRMFCFLYRGRADLERRVLEETRHATVAVEGEMSARVESDTWRLRCEQVGWGRGGACGRLEAERGRKRQDACPDPRKLAVVENVTSRGAGILR